MQKNRLFLHFVMFGIMLLSMLLPQLSFAYDIPTTAPIYRTDTTTEERPTIYICPSTDPGNPQKGLTARLVPCIRDVVTFATNKILQPFADFTRDTILAVFVMAIATFGILLLGGEGIYVSQRGITLLLKIGAILMFLDNFGGLYPKLLDAMEETLNIMASPVANPTGTMGISIWKDGCSIAPSTTADGNIITIWGMLDCYIEFLLGGIFSKTTLYTGIIGFIIGVLFTGTVGLFIALIGFYLIALAIFTIARVVYIFIIAYVAISFVVLIAPICLPCILFATTKDIFDGWLRLLISFFVQPIFLIGYLIMFLLAFNTTMFHGKYSLYYAIAGETSQNPGFKIGEWLSEPSKHIYHKQVIDKDNVVVDQKGAYNNFVRTASGDPQDIIPNPTGSTDIVGGLKNPGSAVFFFGDALNPLNYFETGKEIDMVDWKKLAEEAYPTEYAAAADKDKFYKDYVIRVFLTFLMAAIMMYIFYSLLEYIPFIGTMSMGHGGMPVFGGIGGDGIALRGSQYFGRTLQ